MTSFFDKKVKQPIIELMQSGISAENLSLSLAFGMTGGVFPIPGLTTVPVVVFTFLFRLNPVAALLMNYLFTPLNLATVPGFIYYGNKYLAADGSIDSFSVTDLLSGLKSDTYNTLMEFRVVLLNGILAWLVFVPFATVLLYIVMLPFLRTGIKSLQKASKKKKH